MTQQDDSSDAPASPLKAGHTPGPWEISQEPPRWIIQARAPIGKTAVAFMVGDYVKCGADARLIAAAPDLLAALKQASIALDDAEVVIDADDCVETFHSITIARHAIAAALAKAQP